MRFQRNDTSALERRNDDNECEASRMATMVVQMETRGRLETVAVVATAVEVIAGMGEEAVRVRNVGVVDVVGAGTSDGEVVDEGLIEVEVDGGGIAGGGGLTGAASRTAEYSPTNALAADKPGTSAARYNPNLIEARFPMSPLAT